MDSPPDIFEYYDHRVYLWDHYTHIKKNNPSFSYRYIAKKCGFSSPSFFKKVLDGTNALSMNTILVLAQLLKLSRRDKEYFELMVLYNQANTHQEKKYFLEKISSIKKIQVKNMDPYQYEFFKNWYNIAILELLEIVPFNGDFKELASLVEPTIKPDQAKKAVQLLETLNLIRKNEDGFYIKTNQTLSTGYEARSTAIQNFQLETMELGKEAIDRFNLDEREIATLSLSISEDLMLRIKDRLKFTRREILEMAKLDEKPERVYQINIQAFPISKKIKGEKDT